MKRMFSIMLALIVLGMAGCNGGLNTLQNDIDYNEQEFERDDGTSRRIGSVYTGALGKHNQSMLVVEDIDPSGQVVDKHVYGTGSDDLMKTMLRGTSRVLQGYFWGDANGDGSNGSTIYNNPSSSSNSNANANAGP